MIVALCIAAHHNTAAPNALLRLIGWIRIGFSMVLLVESNYPDLDNLSPPLLWVFGGVTTLVVGDVIIMMMMMIHLVRQLTICTMFIGMYESDITDGDVADVGRCTQF
jgi:hypothetical protein